MPRIQLKNLVSQTVKGIGTVSEVTFEKGMKTLLLLHVTVNDSIYSDHIWGKIDCFNLPIQLWSKIEFQGSVYKYEKRKGKIWVEDYGIEHILIIREIPKKERIFLKIG